MALTELNERWYSESTIRKALAFEGYTSDEIIDEIVSIMESVANLGENDSLIWATSLEKDCLNRQISFTFGEYGSVSGTLTDFHKVDRSRFSPVYLVVDQKLFEVTGNTRLKLVSS